MVRTLDPQYQNRGMRTGPDSIVDARFAAEVRSASRSSKARKIPYFLMSRPGGIPLASTMARRCRGALNVGVLTLLFALPALAKKQEPPLSDYIVTSWTIKDGLSSSIIWALAQDADGYLWLGTNGGLIRFDGVQFSTLSSLGGAPLPKATVRSLFRAHDGSLWIGFSNGEICHFQNGQLRSFSANDNGRGVIVSFAEDRSGAMWAGTATGLLVFDGDRWQSAGGNSGLSEARIITTPAARRQRGTVIIMCSFLVSLWD